MTREEVAEVSRRLLGRTMGATLYREHGLLARLLLPRRGHRGDDRRALEARTGSPILRGERVELSFAGPAPALGRIADVVRRREDTGARRTLTSTELAELARRKLGRLSAFTLEQHIVALSGLLEPEENVLDLAFVAGKPDGLLAVTPRRLLFVPAKGAGTGPPASIALADLRSIAVVDPGTIEAETTTDVTRWERVDPTERAEGIVQLAAARMNA